MASWVGGGSIYSKVNLMAVSSFSYAFNLFTMQSCERKGERRKNKSERFRMWSTAILWTALNRPHAKSVAFILIRSAPFSLNSITLLVHSFFFVVINEKNFAIVRPTIAITFNNTFLPQLSLGRMLFRRTKRISHWKFSFCWKIKHKWGKN